MERFVPKNGVPKNGFPIVFSKSDLAGGGLFLSRKFFLKKPNFPECAQVLLVTWVKLNSINAHLSPPPTYIAEECLLLVKLSASFWCSKVPLIRSGAAEYLLMVQQSAPYKLWCSRVHPSSAAECAPSGAAECPFWCSRVPPSGAKECLLLVQH